MLLWGSQIGIQGYLPLYLRNIGWTTVGADGAFTAFNGASTAGVIPMILLANRLKLHKRMLFFSMIITTVFLALLPFLTGSSVWALIIIAAILRSSAFAIINVLIFDIKGIGNTYGGTATGLVSSIGMIGGFLAPPMGNSLAGIGPGTPFFFWSGMAAVSLPLFLFLRKPKETELAPRNLNRP
jgi:MFS family permease